MWGYTGVCVRMCVYVVWGIVVYMGYTGVCTNVYVFVCVRVCDVCMHVEYRHICGGVRVCVRMCSC